MADQGKEDTPRPMFVDKETFSKNWELAFGKKLNRFEQFDKDKLEEEANESILSSEKDGNDGEG